MKIDKQNRKKPTLKLFKPKRLNLRKSNLGSSQTTLNRKKRIKIYRSHSQIIAKQNSCKDKVGSIQTFLNFILGFFFFFHRIMFISFYRKENSKKGHQNCYQKEIINRAKNKKLKISLSIKNNNQQLLNRQILALDLDNTLIYSQEMISSSSMEIEEDFSFSIKSQNFKVNSRPFLKKFLQKMNKIYDIVIYTASKKVYADPIINFIDECKVIKRRYYRNSCIFNSFGCIKNLSIIDKNVNKIILVDDKPSSYSFQPESGIYIPPWTGDKKDTELQLLIPLLENIFKIKQEKRNTHFKFQM